MITSLIHKLLNRVDGQITGPNVFLLGTALIATAVAMWDAIHEMWWQFAVATLISIGALVLEMTAFYEPPGIR